MATVDNVVPRRHILVRMVVEAYNAKEAGRALTENQQLLLKQVYKVFEKSRKEEETLLGQKRERDAVECDEPCVIKSRRLVGSLVTLESTGLGEIIHKASNGFCVFFALLNVLLLAKGTALADYLYSLNSPFSNFSTLAVLVEKFSIQLKKVFDGQTIEWLIGQTKGKFLVEIGTHAVSVDCKKRVLYDCGETYVLPLTLESFEHCGLKVITDLRQVYDRRKTI